jgi:hypothetical protein
LKESPIIGHSVLSYAHNVPGAVAYRELARELTAQPPASTRSRVEHPHSDETDEAAKEGN